MSTCHATAGFGGPASGFTRAAARWLRLLGGAIIALCTAATAQASLVTVQFEGVVGQVVYANYTEGGLRFSPNSHLDGVAGPTGTWLGWDTVAQPNVPPFIDSNPDWLGPADLSPNTNGGTPVAPWMYVDAGGDLFTLLALDVMAYQIEFLSSRGGHLLSSGVDPYPQHLAFAGDEWANLEWLLMRAISPGLPAGIDNMVVDVPEPTSMALVMLALSLAAAMRLRLLQPRRWNA